jgi:hypothetical protein
MKRVLTLAFGLYAFAAAPSPAWAEWGWPPPGYSVTGVRACDGSHYRGLCALLRDRRHCARPGCVPASPAAAEPSPCSLQASSGELASPQPLPQPATLSAGPRP